MPNLTGKTIFITGGSVGIGFAVATACAKAGARVAIAARTEKDLKEALSKLPPHAPPHALRILDTGDQKSVKEAAQWAQNRFGALDGLVNCAGIYGPIGPLHEISMDEFEKAIRINFLGTAFMCHYFAPLLAPKKGRIINFSGGGAATPFANYSAYATSKIAIVRLTENLAEEFKGLGIAVNAVAPGFVATRMHQETIRAGAKAAGAAFLEKTKAEVEKGGVPPEKAADLTAFLLSEESDGITGKFISAPWDDWGNPKFQETLKARKNFTTLRRIDDKSFYEKS